MSFVTNIETEIDQVFPDTEGILVDLNSEFPESEIISPQTPLPAIREEIQPERIPRVRIRPSATDGRIGITSRRYICIGVVLIPIVATNKIVSDTTTAVYKKANCDSLSGDK